MSSAPPTCPRCGTPLPTGDGSRTPACPRCLLDLARGDDPELVATGLRGAGPAPPSLEELAPFFPGLALEERIGVGGMGTVYRARQKSLDRAVALKVLHPSVATRESFSERFAREARTLASLQHANIVTVHDHGRAGPWYYLVMELVDGVDLRHLMAGREVSPREALAIVGEMCDALQYAHDEGVVHRDIKPENVLVDRRGRVRILDFGLAKLVGRVPEDHGLTRTAQVMGTPHYMAPEQWERPLEVDHRADIYSLGVVFYELLTGELPVGRFAPPSERVRVDVRLDGVVLRALAREPERRYQRAGEVRTDVDRIRSDASVQARGPTPVAEVAARRRARSDRPLVLVLAVVVGGYLLMALVLLGLAALAGHPLLPVPW